MFAENASWQIDKEFGEGRSAWVRPEEKNKRTMRQPRFNAPQG